MTAVDNTRRYPLRLGFLSFSSYLERPDSPQTALNDGLELFRHAERIGLDGGWLRVRHFERGLTGVFPFLGAVSQITNRLRIGTAVVPIAHESPVRLAEDAATADLLSNGRVELGVSGGLAVGTPVGDIIAAVYGHDQEPDLAGRPRRVLQRFLGAIRGETQAATPEEFRLQFTETGEGLRVYPHSSRLVERIWYGAGTEASTIRAARLGLNLQLSTINTESESTEETVPRQQAHFVRKYLENIAPDALELANPRPREVSISRYVIPYSNPEERERFFAASDKHIPGVTGRFGQGWKGGSVEEVIEQLLADEAINEARKHFETTLLLNLPSQLGLEWTKRLLELCAQRIAPAIGWSRH